MADGTVSVSQAAVPGVEGTATLPNGIHLAYSTYGDENARPLLMVMGLGGPSIWWDDDLCAELARRGFYVIRFDNRDIGRSTHLTGAAVRRGRIVTTGLGGRRGRAPYTMDDLADDAFGLLDHLGIAAAHVCGASMGGMIAQTMAIARPERVLSLVSMMSTTGRRTVGWQHPRLLPLLFARRRNTRADYVRRSAKVIEAIGSPGYREPLEEVAERANLTWDRGVTPAGVQRQMLAILSQPDRTPALRRLRVPTLVVHGTADRLVHPSGGRATAAAIPGAELMLIPGMGHDLPRALHHAFVDGIARTAERAERSPRASVRAAPPHTEATSSNASSSSSASRR